MEKCKRLAPPPKDLTFSVPMIPWVPWRCWKYKLVTSRPCFEWKIVGVWNFPQKDFFSGFEGLKNFRVLDGCGGRWGWFLWFPISFVHVLLQWFWMTRVKGDGKYKSVVVGPCFSWKLEVFGIPTGDLTCFFWRCNLSQLKLVSPKTWDYDDCGLMGV